MKENDIGTSLLNFGETVLKSGITRCVNGLEAENLPPGDRDSEEF